MSKLKKYTTSYDNDPNSDIGASKRVVKEYKKLLEKEKLQPIMKEMNNQTKSVVTNLNDYSLLLKIITQNLVNADLYLSNPDVSKSKGAGRYIGGGLTEGEKKKIIANANKKGINTAAQVGCIGLSIKYLLKSKCDNVNLCYGLIKVHRNVKVEEELEMKKIELGIKDDDETKE